MQSYHFSYATVVSVGPVEMDIEPGMEYKEPHFFYLTRAH